MYHQLTDEMRRRRSIKRIVGGIVVVVLLVVTYVVSARVTVNLREQGAASVHDAVIESAMQCAAIEGSYPQSLSHLEQYYGLTINHRDYIVTYEAFASNVLPSVVVVPR